jgi:imidazolonepropionase-like amidohydrolase
MRMRPLALPLVLALAAAPLGAQDGSIAVRAGKAVLADGTVLENATLVVQHGVVTAFGAGEVEIPFDVLLQELPDATLFPGFFETHSSAGMDRPNENIPVAPFLDVRDSIDPVHFAFEDALRQGTLAIGVIPGNECVFGGRGRVVAPFGMTVEDMTLNPDMGVKMAFGPRRGWSRTSQQAEIRETLAGLDRALREMGQRLLDGKDAKADADRLLTEEERKKRKDEEAWNRIESVVRYGDDFPGKKLISNLDLDDGQYALVRILNGEERLWVWAPTATDVATAKEWLEERKLLERTVFVVTSAAWKAADLLAGAGLGVVLDGDLWHVERDPVTWKEVRTFAPAKFHEAGVPFALSSDPGRVGPDRLGFQAALCLREGLPRAAAFAAVTATPARLWGMEARLGHFGSGADGTFLLLSGDPLAADAQVLEGWVRGVKIYDRATDKRLQRLLEGRQQ